jgi:hypothetical protein
MGNQDSTRAEETGAIIPREANAFLSANIERLAGGTEQAASEELGTDYNRTQETQKGVGIEAGGTMVHKID